MHIELITLAGECVSLGPEQVVMITPAFGNRGGPVAILLADGRIIRVKLTMDEILGRLVGLGYPVR